MSPGMFSCERTRKSSVACAFRRGYCCRYQKSVRPGSGKLPGRRLRSPRGGSRGGRGRTCITNDPLMKARVSA